MKIHRLLFLATALAVLAAGCASLVGPRDIVLPLDRMQQALDRRFPVNERFLQLFDIAISKPRLILMPSANRIATSFDLRVTPVFGKYWQGSIDFSGSLRIDAARNAVVLAEPRVDHLQLQGVEPRVSEQLTGLGNRLADQVLRDLPLYNFNPEDLRYAGMRFTPVAIATRADGLVVSLAPLK